MAFVTRIARARVPLGFAISILALASVAPTWTSCLFGGAIALGGELLRVWAAGHLRKGREITRSGPYRYVRHPLYLGSTVMAIGFLVAARSVIAAMAAGTYLAVTLFAAIRTEESTLDRKFEGGYARYRRGEAPPADRTFSWSLVAANREYRAAAGLMIVFAYLFARAALGQH